MNNIQYPPSIKEQPIAGKPAYTHRNNINPLIFQSNQYEKGNVDAKRLKNVDEVYL
jgi:hypothetical protein